MQTGRIVGYALLGLVDALVPAVVAAVSVLEIGVYGSGGLWDVALVVGVAVLAVGAVAGAVSAARGGESFPLTRGVLRLWRRYWWI